MEPVVPVVMKQAIYWLSFIYFPLAGALLWQIFVRKSFRVLSILALIPLTLLAYARFIEPQRLFIVEHEVEICGEGLPGTLRAAVVADLHLGIFPHAISTERVVKRINRANVDLVLMPGDFTYHLKTEKFDKTFAAFSKLDMPAYAVMGNHDVGLPGPDVAAPLTEALEKVGVTILNAKETIFSADGKFLRIVGFRDYWAHTKRNEELGEMPEKASGMPIIF
ncbi:MAG: metallophosphoesterase, partial [Pseudomonadota bacterium]